MRIYDFTKLELKVGDYIWIMNEKGEIFWGNYNGGFDNNNQTFQFRNHSNGKIQTIEINNLQQLELRQRT